MFVRGGDLEYSPASPDPTNVGVVNEETTPLLTEQAMSTTDEQSDSEETESNTESTEHEEPILTALFKALLVAFRKVQLYYCYINIIIIM